jgi:putative PIG3 family NAD(P)H quinone oxidoreductase
MRAIEISTPGPPDVLRLVERPAPEPAPGEVLIEVSAAGVNRPDVQQRLGRYPPPPGASALPGLEIAGSVVACGAAVTGWKTGDRVCALVSGGGYAEYCAAPEGQCLPVPAGLDEVAAAGMPETFFTVWTNVFERARLAKGETLLVHGGSSGIGTTAIQFGVAFGARVLTTAGTAEKCAACERLGAERAINYRTEDFVTEVMQATQGRGVDVVLDMVAGPYVPRNLQVLAVEGRLAIIALLGGSSAEIALMPVMQRRLTITGSTLRPRTVEQKSAIARALEAHVWPLVERGVIRPVVHATFPLARAADAHRLMEAGEHIGKIILTVRP